MLVLFLNVIVDSMFGLLVLVLAFDVLAHVSVIEVINIIMTFGRSPTGDGGGEGCFCFPVPCLSLCLSSCPVVE